MNDSLTESITQPAQAVEPVVSPQPLSEEAAALQALRGPSVQPSQPQGPSLDDAITGKPEENQAGRQIKVNPGRAITRDQLLGVAGTILSNGLDPNQRAAFLSDYKQNEMVLLGLEVAELEQTLANLGLSIGNPDANPWLKLGVGAAAIIGGGLLLRQNYANAQFQDPKTAVAHLAQRDPEELARILEEMGFSRADGGFRDSDIQRPDLDQQSERDFDDLAF